MTAKKLIFISMFFMAAAPACAGESCLTKAEIKVLNDIRSREMAERLRHPGCARSWGAACISPFDQAGKQWLERKENGDPKACAPAPDKKAEDREAQEE